uniref:Uncharacterized protein n=1 Tax=Strongyloides venezuelensis TaxID=75913 RepID=A0A0K0FKM2_STRVS
MNKINQNEEENFRKCALRKNKKAALDDTSNDLDIAQNNFDLLQRKVDKTITSEKDDLFKKIASISKNLDKKKELKMLLQNGYSQQRTAEIDSEIQKLMKLLGEEKTIVASSDTKHSQMKTDIQSTNAVIEGHKSKVSHLDETIAGTKGRIKELLSQKNAIIPHLDMIKMCFIDSSHLHHPQKSTMVNSDIMD